MDFVLFSVKEFGYVSHPWNNVSETSSVLWFFLGPGNAGISVFLKLSNDFFEWEWTKTFNSKNCNIINLVLVSVIFKVIVNLSRTQYNLSNLILGDQGLTLIFYKSLKLVSDSKVFNITGSTLESQKLLWSHDDNRFSERSSHMSS